MIFLPAWYWAIPGGVDYGLLTVDTLHEAFAVVARRARAARADACR